MLKKAAIYAAVVALLVGCGDGGGTTQAAPKTVGLTSDGDSSTIPMPEDQKAFVRANLEAKSAAEKAENDMQKGAAKAVRNKAICDLLRLKRVVSGWVGSVESIGANGDGFGVVSIMIADDVYIKTWNNALSDYGDNTLIKPGTELFDTAATLKKGQLVEFDGTFIKGKADGECVHESSMSLDGSLREPEYVFSFRRIKPL